MGIPSQCAESMYFPYIHTFCAHGYQKLVRFTHSFLLYFAKCFDSHYVTSLTICSTLPNKRVAEKFCGINEPVIPTGKGVKWKVGSEDFMKLSCWFKKATQVVKEHTDKLQVLHVY